jgi:aspartate dehydrogenase
MGGESVRVGILGWGAIGSELGQRLAAGALENVELAAVATRTPTDPVSVRAVEPDQLAAVCDVVVEAAGHQALAEHVPSILGAGCQVIAVSTGALRDQALFDSLVAAGGSKLMLSTGAIGGIDLVAACRYVGAVHSIRLCTTKPSSVLVQPWMDDAMAAALRAGERRVQCFSGPAIEATERFPASVNVAATLAMAAGSWDNVEVTVVGDPTVSTNSHTIEVRAEAGEYRVEVTNQPLASNPASSALVVASLMRALDTLAGAGRRFV